MGEQRTLDPQVAGSNPAAPANEGAVHPPGHAPKNGTQWQSGSQLRLTAGQTARAWGHSSMGEQRSPKPQILGSNPDAPAMR